MRSAGCRTGRVSGPRLLARQFPAQPEIPQGEFTSPEDLKEKGSRAAKAAWEVPARNQSNRPVRHAGRLNPNFFLKFSMFSCRHDNDVVASDLHKDLRYAV